jgi:hypothetical protein
MMVLVKMVALVLLFFQSQLHAIQAQPQEAQQYLHLAQTLF